MDKGPDQKIEITLLDYLKVPWRYKWLIISVVFFAALVAAIYAWNLPNIYKAQCVISLDGERDQVTFPMSDMYSFSRDKDRNKPDFLSGLLGLDVFHLSNTTLSRLTPWKFELAMMSNDFTKKMIEQDHFLPVLYPESWDSKKNKWIGDREPGLQEAQNYFRSMAKIKPSAVSDKALEVSVETDNPEKALKILQKTMNSFEKFLRDQAIAEINGKKDYYANLLKTATDPYLRNRIRVQFLLYAEKELFVLGQSPYGFEIIDHPSTTGKKLKPVRSRILAVAVSASFLFSLILAYLLNFVRVTVSSRPGHTGDLPLLKSSGNSV